MVNIRNVTSFLYFTERIFEILREGGESCSFLPQCFDSFQSLITKVRSSSKLSILMQGMTFNPVTPDNAPHKSTTQQGLQ